MNKVLKNAIHNLYEDLLYYINEGENFALSSQDYGIKTEVDWLTACDIASERILSYDKHYEIEDKFDYWWDGDEGFVEIIFSE